jgi:hypothetical protein
VTSGGLVEQDSVLDSQIVAVAAGGIVAVILGRGWPLDRYATGRATSGMEGATALALRRALHLEAYLSYPQDYQLRHHLVGFRWGALVRGDEVWLVVERLLGDVRLVMMALQLGCSH